MSLAALFFVFIYVGSFTIGGGLVALTFMQQEIVGRGLLTLEEFFSMVGVSESTPGPIGINMATYIGYRLHGIVGGFVATLGTVLPSLVVIMVIARFFGRFTERPAVRAVLYGLRAGTTGMIAVAGWQVLSIAVCTIPRFKETCKVLDLFSWPAVCLFVVSLVTGIRTQWHPLVFVTVGALFGILFL